MKSTYGMHIMNTKHANLVLINIGVESMADHRNQHTNQYQTILNRFHHIRDHKLKRRRDSKNTGDHTIARRSIALQQSSQIPIFASADLSSGGEIGELDVYDYPSDEPLEEGEIREFPKQMEKPELKRNRRKKRKHRNHNCKARKRRRKGDYDYDSWSTTAVKSDAMDEDDEYDDEYDGAKYMK
eukprot:520544_1